MNLTHKDFRNFENSFYVPRNCSTVKKSLLNSLEIILYIMDINGSGGRQPGSGRLC